MAEPEIRNVAEQDEFERKQYEQFKDNNGPAGAIARIYPAWWALKHWYASEIVRGSKPSDVIRAVSWCVGNIMATVTRSYMMAAPESVEGLGVNRICAEMMQRTADSFMKAMTEPGVATEGEEVKRYADHSGMN